MLADSPAVRTKDSPAQPAPGKVKPLLIDLSKRYGGASAHALTLAKGMQDWDAAIAVLQGSPVGKAAAQRGIPTVAVGRSRLDPRIPFRIAGAIRRDRFQLVDTQNIQSKVWGSIAAAMIHVALVSTLNSSYADEHGRSLKGRVYGLVDRLTNSNVERWIAVSESIRTWLCSTGVPDARIEVIHNGITVEPPTEQVEPREWRRDLALPDGAIICTAVGRLVWAKGFEDLIEAFSTLRDRMPKLHCVIVGDGVLRATLQLQIAQAGLSERIHMLGERTHQDVLAILRISDIFVMPSRSEGIPYALLEAGALGLPVVATHCGGIPEVVEDGLSALLVRPSDAAGLASALERIANDPELAWKLGEGARRRISMSFSAQVQVAATKHAYQEAVARRVKHNTRREVRNRSANPARVDRPQPTSPKPRNGEPPG